MAAVRKWKREHLPMQRVSCLIVTVIATLASQATPACAQLYSGYGPLGGGYGWGWYGGAGSTVQGDIARGLGEFAVGAGMYNELTARAGAINTDTRIRGNQYLFLSQMAANRRYLEHN